MADALLKGLLPGYVLIGVYSRTAAKADRLAAKMEKHGYKCKACKSLEKLLTLKPDFLVEAASPAAMKELALPTLKTVRLSLHYLSGLWLILILRGGKENCKRLRCACLYCLRCYGRI